MGLNASKANLVDALKQLRIAMDRARMDWDDETARRFAREVIDPLDAAVLHAAKGMDHVGEVMARVRRECGDDDR